jgi:murein endopeptidase
MDGARKLSLRWGMSEDRERKYILLPVLADENAANFGAFSKGCSAVAKLMLGWRYQPMLQRVRRRLRSVGQP